MVSHPVGAQALFDLIGRQHLRVDEVVQTHILEELAVLGKQVFVVVNTC